MSSAQLEVQNDETECGEKIHLFADARNASDAVVAIRWCICPSIFEKIKKERLLNPHLLLVVTDGRYELARKLVPLTQEMEYFYFRRPGLHKIQATILCGKSASNIREFFLDKRSYGGYAIDLLENKGILREDFTHASYGRSFDGVQIGKGEVAIVVAKEFFAKKPPRFLWNWVNLWYETEPRDQCQFRRRCMLAFSLQPPVVLVWSLIICFIRLVLAMAFKFGIGMRGVSFEPAYKPLSRHTKDVCDIEKEKSVFIADKNGKPRPWFLALFMPAIIMALFSVVNIAKQFLFTDLDSWWVPVITLGAIGAVATLNYLFLLFAMLVDKLFSLSSEREDRQHRKELIKRWRGEQRELAILRMYDQTYSPLVCQGVPLKASLDALPKQRRTIYLRFMDLKTKVCKPFAK